MRRFKGWPRGGSAWEESVVPRSKEEETMSELQVTAYCNIHDGKLEDFKAAAAACLASVREKDTGTVQYDWFFNPTQTQCLVRERYASSEAVLEHIGNLGDRLGTLMETCDLSVEIFGSPSDELKEAVAPLTTETYSFYQGL